jgi:hypothetical protein
MAICYVVDVTNKDILDPIKEGTVQNLSTLQ